MLLFYHVGGVHSELGQPGLTHLVTCDLVEADALPPTPSSIFVVRQQVDYHIGVCLFLSFTSSVVLGKYSVGSLH